MDHLAIQRAREAEEGPQKVDPGFACEGNEFRLHPLAMEATEKGVKSVKDSLFPFHCDSL